MSLSASSLDLSDAVLLGYFIGALSTVLIGGLTNSFVLGRKQKYEKLIRWTEHLLNYDNQIVTVTDLVLKTQLSPNECQEFLDRFIAELGGKTDCTESGQVYYQFSTAKNLELKKLPEEI